MTMILDEENPSQEDPRESFCIVASLDALQTNTHCWSLGPGLCLMLVVTQHIIPAKAASKTDLLLTTKSSSNWYEGSEQCRPLFVLFSYHFRHS